MKKFFLAITVVTILSTFNSCSPESLDDNEEIELIDKNKVTPPDGRG